MLTVSTQSKLTFDTSRWQPVIRFSFLKRRCRGAERDRESTSHWLSLLLLSSAFQKGNLLTSQIEGHLSLATHQAEHRRMMVVFSEKCQVISLPTIGIIRISVTSSLTTLTSYWPKTPQIHWPKSTIACGCITMHLGQKRGGGTCLDL